MNSSNAISKQARIAGLIFFVWAMTGLFGLMYLPSQINLRDAQSILAHEFLFRIGILNGLFSAVLWVLLALALYRLLRQIHEFQAKLLVALVIVQVPAIFMTEAFNLSSLLLIKGEVLQTFDPSQREDLALLFLRINDAATLALELFWGLWLFPLALLVYRSRFLPRFLGVWLVFNGFAYLLLFFTNLLLTQYGKMIYQIAFPAFFGELALALWLLIKGAKERHPVQQEIQQG